VLFTTVQGIKVVLGDSSSEGSSSSSSAGSTYTARLVGTDALHDLAVLQVGDRGMQRLHLRQHTHLKSRRAAETANELLNIYPLPELRLLCTTPQPVWQTLMKPYIMKLAVLKLAVPFELQDAAASSYFFTTCLSCCLVVESAAD
jgi:hypothetical protein